jgi:sugar/nucleoside kinase (ribokinase family)
MPVALPICGGVHQNVTDRRIEPGGSANFLVAARNLGIDVAAAGTVGDDVYGAQILAPLRAHDVDVSQVVVLPGSTSTLVLTLTDRQSGEHVFIGHYGDGPDMPYPAGLDAKIEQADAVFLSGYTLVEKRIVAMTSRAVETARSLDKPVYMDVGPLLQLADQKLVEWALQRTSVLFLTGDEAALVAREAQNYADLLRHGPQIAVVKRGPQGCLIVSRDEWIEVPAFRVDHLVDTVGAGDNFDAAFMAGMLSGLDRRDCARLANAMGAATAQKIGAGTNAPTCAELMAIFERAGETINFRC